MNNTVKLIGIPHGRFFKIPSEVNIFWLRIVYDSESYQDDFFVCGIDEENNCVIEEYIAKPESFMVIPIMSPVTLKEDL